MTLSQDVDSIISEENITDATPAVTPEETQEQQAETVEQPVEETVATTEETDTEKEAEESTETESAAESQEEKEAESDERSASETIEEARTLIGNLNLTEDKIFNDDGSVKPWNEVVPAGAYLASQLEPVKVTDKDGKVHEFMLLSDVEKAFPSGFEAKNNIEQMKFERQILANETKFDEAVKTYQDAEAQYNRETGSIVENRSESTRISNEYKAMADAGLVPKVGDPSDPKFGESDAVKELNGLLEYMDKKNAELAKQGLGQVTSLYIAKQLMDAEGSKVEKEDKKQQIINERQEVASLSSSPTPAEQTKKVQYDIPMSRLADSIIAEEGLR